MQSGLNTGFLGYVGYYFSLEMTEDKIKSQDIDLNNEYCLKGEIEMFIYILLLRGINVGGNNKVSMKDLKLLLERNGFRQVITYINSGNIIFSSEIESAEKIKTMCDRLILEEFSIFVNSFIVSESDYGAALQKAPYWWGEDFQSKHNAIFVVPPTTVEEVLEYIGETKPEHERIEHFGNVIFWSAPLETFSRTRLSKIVGKPIYNSITIRNSNTAKHLLTLIGSIQ